MLAYVIKSVIYLSLMYIPYMLMLRKESFFRFNRILLVSIMLLSLVLPLCDFHSLSIENNPIQKGMNTIILPDVVINGKQNTMVADTINWQTIIAFVYLAGIAATTIWKIAQIISLYSTIHSCVLWKDKQDGITTYCHAQDIAPFSWMNNIVISEDDYNNNAQEILLHEMGHVIHHHSFDILLANVIQVIQWWNPLAWIFASSLRDVHEYEADDAVLTSGVNICQYQTLLIRKAVANTPYTFANSFNHSLLKKRIKMMMMAKSNPWMRTKALYLLPIGSVALCAFATPELNEHVNKITEKVQKVEKIQKTEIKAPVQASASESTLPAETPKEEEIAKDEVEETATIEPIDIPSNMVFDVVEDMPTFIGGNGALMQFLSKNIHYPEEAEKNGIQGRVICTFIIEPDGSVSNTRIAKSVDPSLDREAMRVINAMPKWNPGKQNGQNVRVKYTLPLTFRTE